MDNFLVFALFGFASGALVGLVALGIAVSYRASGVVNFSAAAFGAISAYVVYGLQSDGLPIALAIVLGLVLGALLGGLTYLAMSLVRDSSVLIKFIITLGLFSAAQAFIQLVWGSTTTTPESFLPTNGVDLGSSIQIGVDRLILLGAAILIATVLAITYRRTLFGLATAAVSESHLFIELSGWSASRVELANYLISGVLSAAAAIALAPIVGLSGATLALLILPALSAALVGRFESFVLIILGALLIGAAQSELSLYSTQIAEWLNVEPGAISGLPDAVPLVVILVVTIVRGRSRLQRGEVQPWLPAVGSGRIPLLPVIIGGAAVIAILLFAPSWGDAMIATASGVMLVLSVVVITGMARQFSLAQYALAGFGGWVAAEAASGAGIPFLPAMVLGVLAAIAASLIVVLPAVRARGMTLAIVTLALALLLDTMIFSNSALTGGSHGLTVPDPSLFGWSIAPLDHPGRYAAFGWFLAGLCVLVAANVRRGRSGRRLLAIGSDESAAASLGVGVNGGKIYAFSLAAGIAGLAGAYLAFQFPFTDFSGYDAVSSTTLVQYSVLGGIGWISGAFVGAGAAAGGLITQLVNETFSNASDITTWLALITGAILAFALRGAPDGIVSVWRRGFADPQVEQDRVRLGVPVVPWRAYGIVQVILAPCLVVGLVIPELEYVGAVAVIILAAVRLLLEIRSRVPSRRGVFESLAFAGAAVAVMCFEQYDVPVGVFIVGQGLGMSQFVSGSSKLSRRFLDRWRFPRQTAERPALPSPRRDPLDLEVRDLTVRFGGVTALEGLSFSAGRGELVGLIGPNGAGKTTLLDTVTGFTTPSEGEVFLSGKPVAGWSPERIARAGLIRSWQSVALFDAMTVRENLLLASDSRSRLHYLTDLVHPGHEPWTEIGQEVIREFQLEPYLDSLPGVLPHGTARLVAIARSLCASPTFLLLDEPAAGLSTYEAEEVMVAVRNVVDKLGIGALVIEHDVPLLLSHCDRMVVLDFGRKIAEGTPDQIRQEESVIAAYLGDADPLAPTASSPTMDTAR